MEAALALKSKGFEVIPIGVSPSGQFDFESYERALDDSVILVSAMMVNNEVGAILR